MKVKRYIGSNTQEVMYKLKSELGSDALILNTRSVRRKGILGFFKKPLIEIVAAVDEDKKTMEQTDYENKLDNINEELVRLRSVIATVNNNEKNALSDKLQIYREKMINNGVDYKVATSILEKINRQVDVSKKDDNILKKIIYYNLLQFLGPVEPINIGHNPQVIFFVGPTGVGKTTTLAKIAAKLVIESDKKIGLITADTYRIAAVEQLKTYSDILKLPLKIIYDANEIHGKLTTYKDMDIVLVDTAGRNHKDKDQIFETNKLINSIMHKDVFLVLSATTDSITSKNIIEQYSFLKEYKIIFTKIDETENYGNILNTKFYTNSPLSYFTTGQNVPDDIEIANTEKIAKLLLGEY